jgi:phosphomannomutase
LPAELIISVSGLRGVVGESLTPAVAARYATAFAEELGPGPVAIGRDGRPSGAEYARLLSAVFQQRLGRQVIELGVAATPTVGVAVRQFSAAGGIQISASHNPAEYNGLKLFSPEGRVVPAAMGARVLARYLALPTDSHPPLGLTADSPVDAAAAHLDLVERICDVDRIRSRRFRVVLDANHGAGGILGQRLLERLGCQIDVLGLEPDGLFAHTPEPTEANLASVLPIIPADGAAIGFCQDPDADRLAIIDERGRYIGEEKTLALCIDHVLRAQRQGVIVTNCSTSRMSEDLAAKYGVPFFRSKVGEANVVDMMLAHDAVLGGEGNGGVIDPRVGLVRDSFAGMALVLDAMAARNLPVGALADELPQYAIHKSTMTLPADGAPAGLAAVERHFSEATADRLDGLRLDFPSGDWLLIRPSNTEPIVRVIAEARTAGEAQRLCQEAAVQLAAVAKT